MPGVVFGCLFIGRIARWLQFVRATMGKPDVSFAPEPNPRPWKTVLAIVAYPTPWVALGLTVWGIHHAIVAPFTNEWSWFYAGFFGGPIIIVAMRLRKVRQLQRERQQKSALPP